MKVSLLIQYWLSQYKNQISNFIGIVEALVHTPSASATIGKQITLNKQLT